MRPPHLGLGAAPSEPPGRTHVHTHTHTWSPSSLQPPVILGASRFRMGGCQGCAPTPVSRIRTQGGSPATRNSSVLPGECRMPCGCPVGRAESMDRREESRSKVEEPQRLKTSCWGLWTQDCPRDPDGTGAPPASGPVNRVADPAPQGREGSSLLSRLLGFWWERSSHSDGPLGRSSCAPRLSWDSGGVAGA